MEIKVTCVNSVYGMLRFSIDQLTVKAEENAREETGGNCVNYLAHVDEKQGEKQSLVEHLNGTSKAAAQFADTFSMGELAFFLWKAS